MSVERYIKAEGRPWKIVMPGYKDVSRIDCLSEDLIKYFNSIMSPEPDEKKVYPCFDCMDVGYIDVVHAYKKNVVGDISLPSYYRWIILPFENMPSLEKVLDKVKKRYPDDIKYKGISKEEFPIATDGLAYRLGMSRTYNSEKGVVICNSGQIKTYKILLESLKETSFIANDMFSLEHKKLI